MRGTGMMTRTQAISPQSTTARGLSLFLSLVTAPLFLLLLLLPGSSGVHAAPPVSPPLYDASSACAAVERWLIELPPAPDGMSDEDSKLDWAWLRTACHHQAPSFDSKWKPLPSLTFSGGEIEDAEVRTRFAMDDIKGFQNAACISASLDIHFTFIASPSGHKESVSAHISLHSCGSKGQIGTLVPAPFGSLSSSTAPGSSQGQALPAVFDEDLYDGVPAAVIAVPGPVPKPTQEAVHVALRWADPPTRTGPLEARTTTTLNKRRSFLTYRKSSIASPSVALARDASVDQTYHQVTLRCTQDEDTCSEIVSALEQELVIASASTLCPTPTLVQGTLQAVTAATVVADDATGTVRIVAASAATSATFACSTPHNKTAPVNFVAVNLRENVITEASHNETKADSTAAALQADVNLLRNDTRALWSFITRLPLQRTGTMRGQFLDGSDATVTHELEGNDLFSMHRGGMLIPATPLNATTRPLVLGVFHALAVDKMSGVHAVAKQYMHRVLGPLSVQHMLDSYTATTTSPTAAGFFLYVQQNVTRVTNTRLDIVLHNTAASFTVLLHVTEPDIELPLSITLQTRIADAVDNQREAVLRKYWDGGAWPWESVFYPPKFPLGTTTHNSVLMAASYLVDDLLVSPTLNTITPLQWSMETACSAGFGKQGDLHPLFQHLRAQGVTGNLVPDTVRVHGVPVQDIDPFYQFWDGTPLFVWDDFEGWLYDWYIRSKYDQDRIASHLAQARVDLYEFQQVNGYSSIFDLNLDQLGIDSIMADLYQDVKDNVYQGGLELAHRFDSTAADIKGPEGSQVAGWAFFDGGYVIKVESITSQRVSLPGHHSGTAHSLGTSRLSLPLLLRYQLTLRVSVDDYRYNSTYTGHFAARGLAFPMQYELMSGVSDSTSSVAVTVDLLTDTSNKGQRGIISAAGINATMSSEALGYGVSCTVYDELRSDFATHTCTSDPNQPDKTTTKCFDSSKAKPIVTWHTSGALPIQSSLLEGYLSRGFPSMASKYLRSPAVHRVLPLAVPLYKIDRQSEATANATYWLTVPALTGRQLVTESTQEVCPGHVLPKTTIAVSYNKRQSVRCTMNIDSSTMQHIITSIKDSISACGLSSVLQDVRINKLSYNSHYKEQCGTIALYAAGEGAAWRLNVTTIVSVPESQQQYRRDSDSAYEGDNRDNGVRTSRGLGDNNQQIIWNGFIQTQPIPAFSSFGDAAQLAHVLYEPQDKVYNQPQWTTTRINAFQRGDIAPHQLLPILPSKVPLVLFHGLELIHHGVAAAPVNQTLTANNTRLFPSAGSTALVSMTANSTTSFGVAFHIPARLHGMLPNATAPFAHASTLFTKPDQPDTAKVTPGNNTLFFEFAAERRTCMRLDAATGACEPSSLRITPLSLSAQVPLAVGELVRDSALNDIVPQLSHPWNKMVTVVLASASMTRGHNIDQVDIEMRGVDMTTTSHEGGADAVDDDDADGDAVSDWIIPTRFSLRSPGNFFQNTTFSPLPSHMIVREPQVHVHGSLNSTFNSNGDIGIVPVDAPRVQAGAQFSFAAHTNTTTQLFTSARALTRIGSSARFFDAYAATISVNESVSAPTVHLDVGEVGLRGRVQMRMSAQRNNLTLHSNSDADNAATANAYNVSFVGSTRKVMTQLEKLGQGSLCAMVKEMATQSALFHTGNDTVTLLPFLGVSFSDLYAHEFDAHIAAVVTHTCNRSIIRDVAMLCNEAGARFGMQVCGEPTLNEITHQVILPLHWRVRNSSTLMGLEFDVDELFEHSQHEVGAELPLGTGPKDQVSVEYEVGASMTVILDFSNETATRVYATNVSLEGNAQFHLKPGSIPFWFGPVRLNFNKGEAFMTASATVSHTSSPSSVVHRTSSCEAQFRAEPQFRFHPYCYVHAGIGGDFLSSGGYKGIAMTQLMCGSGGFPEQLHITLLEHSFSKYLNNPGRAVEQLSDSSQALHSDIVFGPSGMLPEGINLPLTGRSFEQLIRKQLQNIAGPAIIQKLGKMLSSSTAFGGKCNASCEKQAAVDFMTGVLCNLTRDIRLSKCPSSPAVAPADQAGTTCVGGECVWSFLLGHSFLHTHSHLSNDMGTSGSMKLTSGESDAISTNFTIGSRIDFVYSDRHGIYLRFPQKNFLFVYAELDLDLELDGSLGFVGAEFNTNGSLIFALALDMPHSSDHRSRRTQQRRDFPSTGPSRPSLRGGRALHLDRRGRQARFFDKDAPVSYGTTASTVPLATSAGPATSATMTTTKSSASLTGYKKIAKDVLDFMFGMIAECFYIDVESECLLHLIEELAKDPTITSIRDTLENEIIGVLTSKPPASSKEGMLAYLKRAAHDAILGIRKLIRAVLAKIDSFFLRNTCIDIKGTLEHVRDGLMEAFTKDSKNRGTQALAVKLSTITSETEMVEFITEEGAVIVEHVFVSIEETIVLFIIEDPAVEFAVAAIRAIFEVFSIKDEVEELIKIVKDPGDHWKEIGEQVMKLAKKLLTPVEDLCFSFEKDEETPDEEQRPVPVERRIAYSPSLAAGHSASSSSGTNKNATEASKDEGPSTATALTPADFNEVIRTHTVRLHRRQRMQRKQKTQRLRQRLHLEIQQHKQRKQQRQQPQQNQIPLQQPPSLSPSTPSSVSGGDPRSHFLNIALMVDFSSELDVGFSFGHGPRSDPLDIKVGPHWFGKANFTWHWELHQQEVRPVIVLITSFDMGTLLHHLAQMYGKMDGALKPVDEVFGPKGFLHKDIPLAKFLTNKNMDLVQFFQYLAKVYCNGNCLFEGVADALEAFERLGDTIDPIIKIVEEIGDELVHGMWFNLTTVWIDTRTGSTSHQAVGERLHSPSPTDPGFGSDPSPNDIAYSKALKQNKWLQDQMNSIVQQISPSNKLTWSVPILHNLEGALIAVITNSGLDTVQVLEVNIPGMEICFSSEIGPFPVWPYPEVFVSAVCEACLAFDGVSIALPLSALRNTLVTGDALQLVSDLELAVAKPNGDPLFLVSGTVGIGGSASVEVLIFFGGVSVVLEVRVDAGFKDIEGTGMLSFGDIAKLVETDVLNAMQMQVGIDVETVLSIGACIPLWLTSLCWTVIDIKAHIPVWHAVIGSGSNPAAVATQSGSINVGAVAFEGLDDAVYRIYTADSDSKQQTIELTSAASDSKHVARGTSVSTGSLRSSGSSNGHPYSYNVRSFYAQLSAPSDQLLNLTIDVASHQQTSGFLLSKNALVVQKGGTVHLGQCKLVHATNPCAVMQAAVSGAPCPVLIEGFFDSNVTFTGAPGRSFDPSAPVTLTGAFDTLSFEVADTDLTVGSTGVVSNTGGLHCSFGDMDQEDAGADAAVVVKSVRVKTHPSQDSTVTLTSVPPNRDVRVSGGSGDDHFVIPSVESFASTPWVDGSSGMDSITMNFTQHKLDAGSTAVNTTISSQMVIHHPDAQSHHAVVLQSIDVRVFNFLPEPGALGSALVGVLNPATVTIINTLISSESSTTRHHLTGCASGAEAKFHWHGPGNHTLHLGLDNSMEMFEGAVFVAGSDDPQQNLTIVMHAHEDPRTLRFEVRRNVLSVVDTASNQGIFRVSFFHVDTFVLEASGEVTVLHTDATQYNTTTLISFAPHTQDVPRWYEPTVRNWTNVVRCQQVRAPLVVTGLLDTAVFGMAPFGGGTLPQNDCQNKGSACMNHPLQYVNAPVVLLPHNNGTRTGTQQPHIILATGSSLEAEAQYVHAGTCGLSLAAKNGTAIVPKGSFDLAQSIVSLFSVAALPSECLSVPAAVMLGGQFNTTTIITGGGDDGLWVDDFTASALQIDLSSGDDLLRVSGQKTVLSGTVGRGFDTALFKHPIYAHLSLSDMKADEREDRCVVVVEHHSKPLADFTTKEEFVVYDPNEPEYKLYLLKVRSEDGISMSEPLQPCPGCGLMTTTMLPKGLPEPNMPLAIAVTSAQMHVRGTAASGDEGTTIYTVDGCEDLPFRIVRAIGSGLHNVTIASSSSSSSPVSADGGEMTCGVSILAQRNDTQISSAVQTFYSHGGDVLYLDDGSHHLHSPTRRSFLRVSHMNLKRLNISASKKERDETDNTDEHALNGHQQNKGSSSDLSVEVNEGSPDTSTIVDLGTGTGHRAHLCGVSGPTILAADGFAFVHIGPHLSNSNPKNPMAYAKHRAFVFQRKGTSNVSTSSAPARVTMNGGMGHKSPPQWMQLEGDCLTRIRKHEESFKPPTLEPSELVDRYPAPEWWLALLPQQQRDLALNTNCTIGFAGAGSYEWLVQQGSSKDGIVVSGHNPRLASVLIDQNSDDDFCLLDNVTVPAMVYQRSGVDALTVFEPMGEFVVDQGPIPPHNNTVQPAYNTFQMTTGAGVTMQRGETFQSMAGGSVSLVGERSRHDKVSMERYVNASVPEEQQGKCIPISNTHPHMQDVGVTCVDNATYCVGYFAEGDRFTFRCAHSSHSRVHINGSQLDPRNSVLIDVVASSDTEVILEFEDEEDTGLLLTSALGDHPTYGSVNHRQLQIELDGVQRFKVIARGHLTMMGVVPASNVVVDAPSVSFPDLNTQEANLLLRNCVDCVMDPATWGADRYVVFDGSASDVTLAAPASAASVHVKRGCVQAPWAPSVAYSQWMLKEMLEFGIDADNAKGCHAFVHEAGSVQLNSTGVAVIEDLGRHAHRLQLTQAMNVSVVETAPSVDTMTFGFAYLSSSSNYTINVRSDVEVNVYVASAVDSVALDCSFAGATHNERGASSEKGDNHAVAAGTAAYFRLHTSSDAQSPHSTYGDGDADARLVGFWSKAGACQGELVDDADAAEPVIHSFDVLAPAPRQQYHERVQRQAGEPEQQQQQQQQQPLDAHSASDEVFDLRVQLTSGDEQSRLVLPSDEKPDSAETSTATAATTTVATTLVLAGPFANALRVTPHNLQATDYTIEAKAPSGISNAIISVEPDTTGNGTMIACRELNVRLPGETSRAVLQSPSLQLNVTFNGELPNRELVVDSPNVTTAGLGSGGLVVAALNCTHCPISITNGGGAAAAASTVVARPSSLVTVASSPAQPSAQELTAVVGVEGCFSLGATLASTSPSSLPPPPLLSPWLVDELSRRGVTLSHPTTACQLHLSLVDSVSFTDTTSVNVTNPSHAASVLAFPASSKVFVRDEASLTAPIIIGGRAFAVTGAYTLLAGTSGSVAVNAAVGALQGPITYACGGYEHNAVYAWNLTSLAPALATQHVGSNNEDANSSSNNNSNSDNPRSSRNSFADSNTPVPVTVHVECSASKLQAQSEKGSMPSLSASTTSGAPFSFTRTEANHGVGSLVLSSSSREAFSLNATQIASGSDSDVVVTATKVVTAGFSAHDVFSAHLTVQPQKHRNDEGAVADGSTAEVDKNKSKGQKVEPSKHAQEEQASALKSPASWSAPSFSAVRQQGAAAATRDPTAPTASAAMGVEVWLNKDTPPQLTGAIGDNKHDVVLDVVPSVPQHPSTGRLMSIALNKTFGGTVSVSTSNTLLFDKDVSFDAKQHSIHPRGESGSVQLYCVDSEDCGDVAYSEDAIAGSERCRSVHSSHECREHVVAQMNWTVSSIACSEVLGHHGDTPDAATLVLNVTDGTAANTGDWKLQNEYEVQAVVWTVLVVSILACLFSIYSGPQLYMAGLCVATSVWAFAVSSSGNQLSFSAIHVFVDLGKEWNCGQQGTGTSTNAGVLAEGFGIAFVLLTVIIRLVLAQYRRNTGSGDGRASIEKSFWQRVLREYTLGWSYREWRVLDGAPTPTKFIQILRVLERVMISFSCLLLLPAWMGGGDPAAGFFFFVVFAHMAVQVGVGVIAAAKEGGIMQGGSDTRVARVARMCVPIAQWMYIGGMLALCVLIVVSLFKYAADRDAHSNAVACLTFLSSLLTLVSVMYMASASMRSNGGNNNSSSGGSGSSGCFGLATEGEGGLKRILLAFTAALALVCVLVGVFPTAASSVWGWAVVSLFTLALPLLISLLAGTRQSGLCGSDRGADGRGGHYSVLRSTGGEDTSLTRAHTSAVVSGSVNTQVGNGDELQASENSESEGL